MIRPLPDQAPILPHLLSYPSMDLHFLIRIVPLPSPSHTKVLRKALGRGLDRPPMRLKDTS